jgi:hypothetical protein
MSSFDPWSALHTCSYVIWAILGKICRSTHQLGDDANNNPLYDMIYAGSVHIFTICCKMQLSTLNGPSQALNRRYPTLPERGRQPRICPLPPTPDVPTTSPQPSSHRLHRPVLPHSTRGWQPPLKDSLDLLSYTTTMITPTRRGLLGTAVTPGEFVCALTTDFRWCSTTTLQGRQNNFPPLHSRKS